MAPMINMLSLLNDLQQNEWHITAFQFTYKNTQTGNPDGTGCYRKS